MKKWCIFFVTGLFFIACKTKTPTAVSVEEDVAFLASDALKGRATGSEDELKAAGYLAERLEDLGYVPKGEAQTYFQTFSFKGERDPHKEIQYVSAGDSTLTGTNVIGFLDNMAGKTIVLGAHYDHLGMGGDGSLHRGEVAIHNGADDNASGVAAVLQLGKILRDSLKHCNVLLQFYSGEELGLLGSNYFTKNSTVPLEQMNYMINLDMVGRLRPDKTLSISGVGTSPLWNQTLNANNPGFTLVTNESGIGPSDHTSFYLQDIPVLHFFTGQHEDYHRPTDDYQKLNYAGITDIVSYIAAICMDLDDNPKLAFTKTKNESEEIPRFKVGLGVVPDYLFSGKGMRIDGISEDKPAQKAGLQKGDVVVQLGDSVVTDMMSYMRALSAFDEGDATTVVVQRKGENQKFNIQF